MAPINQQTNITKHTFSNATCNQLMELATIYDATRADKRVDSCQIEFDIHKFSSLAAEVEHIRNTIALGANALIIEHLKANSVGEFKSLVWAFSTALGCPMKQNHLDHKMIEVYDRGQKTIEEGARYHQTKQGAYVHNDGVSDLLPIDYLVLACGQKAKLGGESILVDAGAVYVALSAYPAILSELQNDFYFENRGMSDKDELFKAPIFSFNRNGIPLIRYFRVYIEAAHEKANSPLSSRQIEAMNYLDTILESSFVRRHVMLEAGQMLVSADDKFLHTRTTFLDEHEPTENIGDEKSLENLNRYMVRVWLRQAMSSQSVA